MKAYDAYLDRRRSKDLERLKSKRENQQNQLQAEESMHPGIHTVLPPSSTSSSEIPAARSQQSDTSLPVEEQRRRAEEEVERAEGHLDDRLESASFYRAKKKAVD